MVDADYKITYVDIGCQGRISDGGIFKNCELYKLLASNQANIPPPSPANDLSNLNDSFLLESNREANIPNVIVADDAFPITTYSMKSYSQKNLSDSRRIFNCRVSRARRTSENAFGILSNRFRVLSTRIHLKPEIFNPYLLVHLDTLLLNLKKLELCLRTISWDEDKYHGNGSI